MRQAALEIAYRPNHIARSLASGKTDTLGLIVYEVSNPFFAQIVDHIELAARASGYRLMLCNSRPGGLANDQTNLELLIQCQVDGVLLWASSSAPEGYRIPLASNARPQNLVLLGHHAAEEMDYVALHRAAGSYQAARHLTDLGHSRLGYVAPHADLSPEHPKLAGMLRALREKGLPEPLLVPTDSDSRAAGRSAARRARTWHPQPTALLCYNDLIAIGVYWGLREAGLSVPDDVALVGFDGIEEGQYLDAPLTTVEQPVAEMCQTAMQFLVNRIEGRASGAQQRTLVPRLLVRQSCGAAGASAAAP